MITPVRWYHDGYIIEVTMGKRLTPAIMRTICNDIQEMLLAPQPGPVHLLVDLSRLEELDITLIELVQITDQMLPQDKIGLGVTFGNNSSTLFFLIQTVGKTNQFQIQQVRTRVDALELLRQWDKRLFMLRVDPPQDDKQPLA